MKTLLIALLFITTVLTSNAQSKNKSVETETTTFFIENMECANCIKKIEKNISYEKGVTDLTCDLKTKTVSVTYKTNKTSKEKLIFAFDKIKKNASVVENAGKASDKTEPVSQDQK